MAHPPPRYVYSFALLPPNGKSVEELVADIARACSGADQLRVMNALIKVLSSTYSQIDAGGDESSLKQLREVLQRFHAVVESRLVEYALARANPAPPSLAPDDPLPGEVPPTRIH